ncbi:MAG TPA: ribonuclease Z [Bacillota bacterium]|mgnify:FL=1|nr:ribonuclease Z [Bacillota bacterium]HPT61413.1 ribonuclease Z [Bacillota bacterium]
MKLTFLGTGAGKPSKMRNVSGFALDMVENYGYAFLFDCGEGTQHQIMYTNLKLSHIKCIFITHLHGDHIYGLPGLLGTRSFENQKDPLTVYGPKGIKTFLNTVLEVSGTHLTYPLEVVEVNSGDVFHFDRFTIEVALLEHVVPSFGYRLVETSPESLDADKLKELGIPPGPIYGRLKNRETVVVDGKVLSGEDFLLPPKVRRIVTICGDTRKCAVSVQLARDATVLVHEATHMVDEAEKAYKYFHSTSKDAATVAIEAVVKSLVLNHTSSRYFDGGAELLEEARAIFPKTYIAKDLAEFRVKDEGAEPDIL